MVVTANMILCVLISFMLIRIYDENTVSSLILKYPSLTRTKGQVYHFKLEHRYEIKLVN